MYKGEHDYFKVGRAVQAKDPIFFRKLTDYIKECQDKSVKDTALINTYFHYFCLQQQIEAAHIRAVARRGGLELMNTRRLFIAVILKLYDQLYYEGVAGRMADKLRQRIADCLNCHEVWVSTVAPSVIHELRNLKGYQQEVQYIIEAIEPLVAEVGDNIPEYCQTKHSSNQLNLLF